MAVLALLVAVAVGIVLLGKGLYPADLPESRNPDFVDTVFDNRGVVWAARLLLVSAAGVLALGGVFIVASIAIRMKNQEWLRKAGPFEISEGDLSEAEEEAAFWRQTALSSQEEADRLRESLDSVVESLRSPDRKVLSVCNRRIALMAKEKLDREVELALARGRAAIERHEAFSREFDRLAAIHTVRTERVFRELREAARRR